jgi:hypothetical protein
VLLHVGLFFKGNIMASVILNGATSGSTTITPTDAVTVTITMPSTTGTMLTSTSVTTTVDASINGLTVGKGGGAVATNTAVGASALTANTTGRQIVAIGNGALATNITGIYSTAVGYQALNLSDASSNDAFGRATLSSNTTGVFNAAFGRQALSSNVSGSNNSAFGYLALLNNTADSNTAVGYQAGYTNISGTRNVFIGYATGYLSTGDNNCFVGRTSGYNTTGSNNSFFGAYNGSTGGSGQEVTTGSKNTILGSYNGNQAGLDIRTASNYVVLSDGDGNPVGYYKGSNQSWVFGQGGTGYTGDGNVILNGAAPASGNGAVISGQSNGTYVWSIGSYRGVVSGTATWFTCANSGGGGVYLNGASATSWSAVSDETRKIIIEPITDAANKVSTLRAVIGRLKTDDESVRRPYLIAQDVRAVLPEAVSEAEDKEGAVLGLSYTEVIPLLVAAIKELSAELNALKAKVG